MCVSLSLLHRPVLRSSVFSHRSIAVVPTLDSTMFKGDIDKSDVKQYEKLFYQSSFLQVRPKYNPICV